MYLPVDVKNQEFFAFVGLVEGGAQNIVGLVVVEVVADLHAGLV